MKNDRSLPLAASLLIPHRDEMLLLASLTGRSDSEAVGRATVPAAGTLLVEDDGGLLPEYYLELIAQTMAAGKGYDLLLAAGGKQEGFLVGLDALQVVELARPGELLIVTVALDFCFGQVSVISGTVRRGAALMATAEAAHEKRPI